MDVTQKKELQATAQKLSPVIAIGKQGLTPTVISQIKLYLKANKLCKIKYNKEIVDQLSMSKKAFAEHIAKETGATLIDQIGFVIVLHKR